MENTLIRGNWKKGKTILLAEYITTKDLDCHKYILYGNSSSSLGEYLYSVSDEKIHTLNSVNEVLINSRSHNDKIILVIDDISTELGFKRYADIIKDLQSTLKDRLVIVGTLRIWTAERKETEPSKLRTDEIIDKYGFTKVLDIDDNWVYTPEEPVSLYKYKSNTVDHLENINEIGVKWFKIREENKAKYKANKTIGKYESESDSENGTILDLR